MADISLKKHFPDEIADMIQIYTHKARMKKLLKEFRKMIKLNFYNHLIIDSGTINYIAASNTNNRILYKHTPYYMLNSYMWYEFWTEFTELPTHPKRNLSPTLAHRINDNNIYNKGPFKTTPKVWLL